MLKWRRNAFISGQSIAIHCQLGEILEMANVHLMMLDNLNLIQTWIICTFTPCCIWTKHCWKYPIHVECFKKPPINIWTNHLFGWESFCWPSPDLDKTSASPAKARFILNSLSRGFFPYVEKKTWLKWYVAKKHMRRPSSTAKLIFVPKYVKYKKVSSSNSGLTVCGREEPDKAFGETRSSHRVPDTHKRCCCQFIAQSFDHFWPGLPDPPMDVRVDSGPQDGTILVTWIPVTLNITTPGQKVPSTWIIWISIINIVVILWEYIIVIIITITIVKVKTAPITGYAVFADGKRVTDVDSPSSDHNDEMKWSWRQLKFIICFAHFIFFFLVFLGY